MCNFSGVNTLSPAGPHLSARLVTPKWAPLVMNDRLLPPSSRVKHLLSADETTALPCTRPVAACHPDGRRRLRRKRTPPQERTCRVPELHPEVAARCPFALLVQRRKPLPEKRKLGFSTEPSRTHSAWGREQESNPRQSACQSGSAGEPAHRLGASQWTGRPTLPGHERAGSSLDRC